MALNTFQDPGTASQILVLDLARGSGVRAIRIACSQRAGPGMQRHCAQSYTRERTSFQLLAYR